MTFAFGKGPQQQPQQQQQPAATPFGGPPQQGFGQRGPISAQTALQGMSEADVQTRYPTLPPDGQFHLRIDDARIFDGRQVGIALFFDVTVLATSLPSVEVGSRRSVKIDGFSNPDARAFAFSDAKNLLLAAFAKDELTKDWAGDGQPMHWERLLDSVMTCKNPAEGQTLVGREVYAQTSMTAPSKKKINPATGIGWQKLKAIFYPVGS